MIGRAAVLLTALLAAGTHLAGAAPVNVHVFPDRFADPAAHNAAQAVASGDQAAALAAIRQAPGGANTPGAEGATLLLMAVERRDHAMAAALLRAGAKADGAPGYAPLHSAVKNTDLDMVRLLLAAGAKPDATMEGETAMYEAALIGAQDAAGLLLGAGAGIDVPDEVGKTPVLVAASADNWAMVATLLDHGANPWLDAPWHHGRRHGGEFAHSAEQSGGRGTACRHRAAAKGRLSLAAAQRGRGAGAQGAGQMAAGRGDVAHSVSWRGWRSRACPPAFPYLCPSRIDPNALRHSPALSGKTLFSPASRHRLTRRATASFCIKTAR